MKNQTKSIAENWKMNLIEKLGLEKCKAIVDGAPDDIDVFYHIDIGYVSNMGVVGGCTNQVVNCFINGEPSTLNPYFTSVESFIHFDDVLCVEDLRTAIANHERTDDCTDIKNHISPNTKVIEG